MTLLLLIWLFGAPSKVSLGFRYVYTVFILDNYLGSVKIVGLLKNNKHVHLIRWFSHIESLESTQLALTSLIGELDPQSKLL